ncbi:MAG: SURF1 family protein [Candidatus Promineifilaceae bacterium]|nr:SURF1 family protein [Candidatus Promineifilaceae bacterium]
MTDSQVSEQPRSTDRTPVPWRQVPRLLVSRRWVLVSLLVVAGVILLAWLGFWQLDRLAQRQARNAELVRQLSAAPLDLNRATLPDDLTTLRDRSVIVNGRFDYGQQLLLTQQSWQGRPGAHLITPLILNGGGRAVLVDRGWIPAEEVRQADLTSFAESRVGSVNGVIQLTQTLPGGRSVVPDAPQKTWYRVDIEAIEAQMPYELLPVYVQQTPEGGGNGRGELPYRAEPEYDLSDGPHLGYALQWFAFAIMLAVGYVYYVARRSRATLALVKE